MNERIKEILSRCQLESIDGPEYPRWTDLEKFAELIVRECVSIVAKRKDHAIDDGWNVDEAMSMAEMDLEEHFGVEE